MPEVPKDEVSDDKSKKKLYQPKADGYFTAKNDGLEDVKDNWTGLRANDDLGD
jgi:hypothetical protein